MVWGHALRWAHLWNFGSLLPGTVLAYLLNCWTCSKMPVICTPANRVHTHKVVWCAHTQGGVITVGAKNRTTTLRLFLAPCILKMRSKGRVDEVTRKWEWLNPAPPRDTWEPDGVENKRIPCFPIELRPTQGDGSPPPVQKETRFVLSKLFRHHTEASCREL